MDRRKQFHANLGIIKQSITARLNTPRRKIRAKFLGGKHAALWPKPEDLAEEFKLEVQQVKAIQEAINASGLMGRGAWLTIHEILHLYEGERAWWGPVFGLL